MKTNPNEIRKDIEAVEVRLNELEALSDKNGGLTDEESTEYSAKVDELARLNDEFDKAEKLNELRLKGAKDKLKQDKNTADRVANVIPKQTKTDNEDQASRAFNFGKALRGLYTGKFEGVEGEMHQEGVRQLGNIGKSTTTGRHSFAMPGFIANRATVTEGGNSVAGIQQGPIEEGLHAKSVLNGWATFWTGLQDYRIPLITSTTTAWEGETDATADGGTNINKLDLNPTRLACYVDISKQAVMQLNPSLIQAYQRDIQMSVSDAIDTAVFTSTSGAPAYIGTGKTAVTDANINELVLKVMEEVIGNKAWKGNLGYVASHTLMTELFSAVQVSGVSPLVNRSSIAGDPTVGTIAGIPLRVSPFVADIASTQESVYGGDWSQLVIAQFGAVEILFDPYTQAVSGVDRLVLNSYYDFGLKQSNGISVGGYTGTDA